MKQFKIPPFFRSPIISKIKTIRKLKDPMKKDFSATKLDFIDFQLYIARHFGFCYGVENAIEIAYRAVDENKGKRVFLLSQMIHNPFVNDDLQDEGVRFLQDTLGNQLIPWSELTPEDIVVLPAFGTTLEINAQLEKRGVSIEKYNTTCPFVEKVWNRAQKLSTDEYTIVIHGKSTHEETRATFSHTAAHSHAVIVRDLTETQFLCDVVYGKRSSAEFYAFFSGKYTVGFDPEIHLDKLGVINQTTMLATETQAIADLIKKSIEAYNSSNHDKKTFADTRDTLCYATNENQNATEAMSKEDLDLAIVVGGYNSSNTSHLVELLEQKCPTYFVRNDVELLSKDEIRHFDIHTKQEITTHNWLKGTKIGVTSGASCPDSIIDAVIAKLIQLKGADLDIEHVLKSIDH